MESDTFCPECGAAITAETACQDRFNQMLAWEHEDMPHKGQVHHLMVLCYHLQHPSLYSPEGLASAQRLLVEFLESGTTPQEVRRRDREKVDSGRRAWKVTARIGRAAAYLNPIRWPLNSSDVIAQSADAYNDSVLEWARSVLRALRDSGNMPGV